MADYSYPIDPGWKSEEIVKVIALYTAIEQAYESSIKLESLQAHYRGFKEVVTSMSEEKQLDKEFQQASSYSIYRTIQKMKSSQPGQLIKMP